MYFYYLIKKLFPNFVHIGQRLFSRTESSTTRWRTILPWPQNIAKILWLDTKIRVLPHRFTLWFIVGFGRS